MSEGRARAMEPIRCAGCGAPLPLREEPQLVCSHCGATTAVPRPYLEAVALQRQARAARAAIEPKARALAHGSQRGWQVAAGATLALGPPVGTAVGELALSWETSTTYALVVMPAILPGLALWAWAATARRLHDEFRRGVAARPAPSAGAPPGCRECGAPLAMGEPGAPSRLSATCGYCGTESLLVDLPTEELRAHRRRAVRSLVEATTSLSHRRRSLALAVMGGALALALVSLALLAALRAGT